MPKYDIYAFCERCREEHPMGIEISLKAGPAQKQTLGGLNATAGIPAKVKELMDEPVLCPKTGDMFVEGDMNRLFLVPL
jgi:hypothetical protein